jgi:uncharacterized protein YkwD
MDDEYLRLVNEHRTKLGVLPLTFSPVIEEIALEHSTNMSTGAVVFGHEGFPGRCQQLRKELRSRSCSEIVAAGQRTAGRVFEAWLNSPPHRQSIENPKWTHTGLGVARNGEGRLFWTQMFLKLD